MADVTAAAPPEFLREEALCQAMELLFYAYRDFTAEADAILARLNYGRAHHRVIYFVGRHPKITVTDLLGILQITKQSLSRVLSTLINEGYISQRAGPRDRRQRLLELTPQGEALERQLLQVQHRRLRQAFQPSGEEAVEGFRTVLMAMMSGADRARFRATIAAVTAPPPPIPPIPRRTAP